MWPAQSVQRRGRAKTTIVGDPLWPITQKSDGLPDDTATYCRPPAASVTTPPPIGPPVLKRYSTSPVDVSGLRDYGRSPPASHRGPLYPPGMWPQQHVAARARLTGVILACKMTPVIKTQVYLGDEELEALHRVAERSNRSVADLIREAIRRVWIRPSQEGPVGIWDGEPRRTSIDHDSIYDEP